MKIKIGSTRICFVFRSFVVKVPIVFSWKRFVAGMASNYSEAFIWEATTQDTINGEENQQYLCEVYESFAGLILICERVERLTELEFLQMSSYIELKLHNLIPDKTELIHQNVGKTSIDGMLYYKLLDYGTNILIKSSKKSWYLRYLRILREEFKLNP